MCIQYRAGYKYQLAEDYHLDMILPPLPILDPIRCDWYDLAPLSILVKSGYAWDGPSGPTFDTATFMRGALIHDVLYQAIREGHLPDAFRAEADHILYDLCREDGMGWLRAQWVYAAVRVAGGSSADPMHGKPILEAP